MAGDTMRFRNPAGHAGLLHNLLALVNDLAGFLESRLGLFAQESRTALVQVLVLVACLGGAVVLAFLGYALPDCERDRGSRAHSAYLLDLDQPGGGRTSFLSSRWSAC